MTAQVDLGFLPLLDAAPLIVAQRMGFGSEERLSMHLHRARNWSMLRDMLAQGRVDAAQMLAAVPVAGRLGLGGAAADFEAPMVLSLGGQTVAISLQLARALREAGLTIDFRDAVAARDALRAVRGQGLRMGVPFPFSMQTELIRLWLGDMPGLSTVTVAPSRMSDAVASGEIEAFCVGEPWGSHAVQQGTAELLLPGTAIWSAAPEKVLAMRRGWAEENPERAGALMRAVWRACRWLDRAENRAIASDMLAHDDALGIDAEVIERALSGHLLISRQGPVVASRRFITFHEAAANFPWRSQAAWIGRQMAGRMRLDPTASAAAASDVWRPDLFRLHLGAIATMPSAGARSDIASDARAHRDPVTKNPGQFFDGRIFDLFAES